MKEAEELAYLAGILDGEGTLRLPVVYQRNTGHPRYYAEVNVYNTNPHLIDWLLEKWGGNFYYRHRGNKKHKPEYTWRIGGEKAIPLIKSVYPYLILKKEHADILLSLWGLHEEYGIRSGVRVPEEYESKVGALAKAIHILNKRGGVV